MDFDYDLFVLGAGSGGVRASRMSASYGAKVAVAESMFLGGTCVNVGCVPKKLFVYGSHFHEEFQDAQNYGWDVPDSAFHWPTLRDNKTKEISRLNGIYSNLLNDAGVTLYDAHARLLDAHTVQVGEETVTARYILVATGGWPDMPDIPGIEHAISSNEAFYLPDFPEQVTVIGGGYIAVEFAGIFAGLGAKTTLLYRGEMFLRGFDDSIRSFVKEEIEKKGVELLFETEATHIHKQDDGSLRLDLTNGNTLIADTVLCATGRSPKTQDIGLEDAGVALGDNGQVLVNADYQTNVENIYAIGDVTDRVQLTPVAIEEAMCVSSNLFTDQPKRRMDYQNIATAVFCQPKSGTVAG